MRLWEREIVEALAGKVRAFSVEQIERTWWTESRAGRRQAKDSIRRLERAGWLEVRRVIARAVLPLAAPILCWRPGEPAPEFLDIAKLLHQRSGGFATATTVCLPTKQTKALFGAASTANRFKLTQTTHDLHVAEVFLKYRADGFDVGRCWIGEDNLPRYWPIAARPDALLLDDIGVVICAVEYGGDYSPERLQSFHSAFSRSGLAYELW